MKQALVFWGLNGLLLGCISPTATLGGLEEDTAFSKDELDTSSPVVEDSADTESDTEQVEDTEDTDTVDTEEPQDTGPTMLGVDFMREEHLLFDGTYELTLQTLDSSSEFTEFHGFLKVNLSWGFGLRLAPFNAATRTELFNNNEMELFSGAGFLWTLRFKPTNQTNQKLTPIVRVYRLQVVEESIEACQFMEYEYGDTVDLSDIENGFQLLLVNHGTDDFSTRIRLVTDGREEAYFVQQLPTTMSGQCGASSDFSPYKIHFGKQTNFVLPADAPEMPEPIQPIRARVDDLMIFTPLMIENLSNFEQLDLFEPTRTLDADTADANRDGVGWWNFSLQPNQNDQFERVLDESLQTMHPGANTWFMLDAATGQTLSSEEARGNYYVGNQQQ